MEVHASAASVCALANFAVFLGKGIFVVHSPEAPKHCGESDERAECGVDDHVSLPLVAHVAGSRDLHKCEDIPAHEVNPTVCEEHRK